MEERHVTKPTSAGNAPYLCVYVLYACIFVCVIDHVCVCVRVRECDERQAIINEIFGLNIEVCWAFMCVCTRSMHE